MLPDPLIAVMLCIGEDRRRGRFAEPGSDGETRGPGADNQHILDYYRHFATLSVNFYSEKNNMMGRCRRYIRCVNQFHCLHGGSGREQGPHIIPENISCAKRKKRKEKKSLRSTYFNSIKPRALLMSIASILLGWRGKGH